MAKFFDQFKTNILNFNFQLNDRNLKVVSYEAIKNIPIDEVVVLGMGGSGLTGNILENIKKDVGLKKPILVWKNYGLPPENDFKNRFFLFVSFSGNTEEVTSGLEILLKAKASFRAGIVTSGGKLKELSEKFNLPRVIFEAGSLTPRQAIGIMTYASLKILQAALPEIKVSDLTYLLPKDYEEEGKKMARELKNRIISVYSDYGHQSYAYFWKTKFNETSKTLAFSNFLPEMAHNEVVGFENKFKSAAIFLIPPGLPNKLEKKFDLTRLILREQGVKVVAIDLEGKNEEEMIWKNYILSDWVSYYLAKINKKNPTETAAIEKLKLAARQM